jgi:ADP-ribose pyrophosphatase YjhB (NUDIX family)
MLMGAVGTFWKIMPPQLRRWLTRRLHTTFTISAAGIITNADGKVLLLNHVLRSTTSGWGAPGGFISLGEQPDHALRREIDEETGLQLADIRIFRCRTLHRHVEVIMTATGIGEARVKSREIRDLGWFAIDNLPPEMDRGERDLIREAVASSQKTPSGAEI